ncbi:hypothetical protein, partial [Burkholderia ubonensis]|uniref:hypothetical protein n=1 Tax=Burkholderia ubonensis TaxID=101571 RepID=UPI001E4F7243
VRAIDSVRSGDEIELSQRNCYLNSIAARSASPGKAQQNQGDPSLSCPKLGTAISSPRSRQDSSMKTVIWR